MPATEKRKVLVTGATGFIGSHLIEALIERGDDVTCLVLPDDERTWIKHLNVQYAVGDLYDATSLTNAVAGKSHIFHLAGGELNSSNGSQVQELNFIGTKNLVNATLQNGSSLQRFLMASSVVVAGPTGPGEMRNEESECRPISPYGESKLKAEHYIRGIGSDFPFTIVRLPLVFGPRSFRGLYPAFKLIHHHIALDFGEVQTPTLFVKDAVRGLMLAAEHPATRGNVYAIGNEKILGLAEIGATIKQEMAKKTITLKVPYPLLYSLASLCGAYAKVTGKHPALRKRDVESYIKYRYWSYDFSKAQREFGYSPQYSFSEGIRLTAEWYYRHNHLN